MGEIAPVFVLRRRIRRGRVDCVSQQVLPAQILGIVRRLKDFPAF